MGISPEKRHYWDHTVKGLRARDSILDIADAKEIHPTTEVTKACGKRLEVLWEGLGVAAYWAHGCVRQEKECGSGPFTTATESQ